MDLSETKIRFVGVNFFSLPRGNSCKAAPVIFSVWLNTLECTAKAPAECLLILNDHNTTLILVMPILT